MKADHMVVSSGVGAMTWSPLACGIISGKYDGRVPPYSRASLKVDQTQRRSLPSPPHPSLIAQCHPSVHCVYPAARTGPVFCSSCVCVFQVLASPSVCCQWRVDCCVAFFLSAEQGRLPAGVSLTHFSARTHTNTQTHAALNVHIMIWIVRSFIPSFLEKNWKLR